MLTVVDRIGHGRFVSFELWPPRTPESAAALEDALAELSPLGPAFVAVTYGAGGSTRERAIEDCRHVSSSLERLLIERGERVVRFTAR